MSTFGKHQMESTYPCVPKDSDRFTKTLENEKICNHCKKIPNVTTDGTNIGNDSNNKTRIVPAPLIHHHYENCMIEVKNTAEPTT